VAIGESELNLIGEYVQSHLTGWMEKLGVRAPQDPVTNTQLLERVVRVEEELKTGREVMITRFEAMDKRFEDHKASFSARFEDQKANSNERFEDQKASFNKRFSLLTWMIGAIMAIVVAILGVLLA